MGRAGHADIGEEKKRSRKELEIPIACTEKTFKMIGNSQIYEASVNLWVVLKCKLGV